MLVVASTTAERTASSDTAAAVCVWAGPPARRRLRAGPRPLFARPAAPAGSALGSCKPAVTSAKKAGTRPGVARRSTCQSTGTAATWAEAACGSASAAMMVCSPARPSVGCSRPTPLRLMRCAIDSSAAMPACSGRPCERQAGNEAWADRHRSQASNHTGTAPHTCRPCTPLDGQAVQAAAAPAGCPALQRGIGSRIVALATGTQQ